MTKVVLKSVFPTIQGEGIHTGAPAVFVRFAGCNVKCSWCDTDWKNGKAVEIGDLVAHVVSLCGEYNIKHVVITGGEPLDQVNLLAFVEELSTVGRYLIEVISFETSCRGLNVKTKKALATFSENIHRIAFTNQKQDSEETINYHFTFSPKILQSETFNLIDNDPITDRLDDLQVAYNLSADLIKVPSCTFEYKLVIENQEAFDKLLKIEDHLSWKSNVIRYSLMIEDSFNSVADVQTSVLMLNKHSYQTWYVSPRLHKQINVE